MRETCAPDVADRGGITGKVGAILNLTRERIHVKWKSEACSATRGEPGRRRRSRYAVTARSLSMLLRRRASSLSSFIQFACSFRRFSHLGVFFALLRSRF